LEWISLENGLDLTFAANRACPAVSEFEAVFGGTGFSLCGVSGHRKSNPHRLKPVPLNEARATLLEIQGMSPAEITEAL